MDFQTFLIGGVALGALWLYMNKLQSSQMPSLLSAQDDSIAFNKTLLEYDAETHNSEEDRTRIHTLFDENHIFSPVV